MDSAFQLVTNAELQTLMVFVLPVIEDIPLTTELAIFHLKTLLLFPT
jgi:hypothetical protein